MFDHIVTVKTKLIEYVLLYKLFDYAQKCKLRGWNKKSVWLYITSNNILENRNILSLFLPSHKSVCLITKKCTVSY